MVSRIRILPPELASQIAAGEVVERPASVVKELAENALDASATRIEIEIEGGGRELIRVVDDGSGMSAEEAHLALERHATSKLRAAEELFALSTLGFRGEALPSIASVAELTMVTREAGSDAGYRLIVDGGRAQPGEPVGAPRGTQVEVRRLFEHVPARLKFLKAEATESGHVADTVLKLALAHPQVHFRLRSGGRAAIDLPPHPSLLERARAALSRRGQVALFAARGAEGEVQVEACLGAPSESGSTSRATYLFVNRRPVRDRTLLHALALGYGETIERGRYPLAVLRVELPPADVDVNVHPQKAEVRFARPQEVAAAVRRVVGQAVARAPWLEGQVGGELRVYSLPPERPPAARDGGEAGFEEQRKRIHEALSLFGRREEAAPPQSPAPRDARPVDDRGGFFRSLRYLGQLHKTYLVCQADGELVLIDQHAAHERVAFERLRAAHGERALRTQRLLFPCTLYLDAAQAQAATEHAATLAALGFDLEPFGGQSFAVKAVPEPLAEAALGEVVADVLDQLGEGGTAQAVSDRLDNVLATMACHSVVRAGDVLDDARARALLDSMDGVDFRAHCPHGRPVLLRMSIGEIERRFGR